MKRRQCSHAAAAVARPMPAIASAPARSPRFGTMACTPSNRPPATPPTKAINSRMLGSAIRRLAVKYSASTHAVPATNTPLSGRANVVPICPTATSSSTIAIETKMSLKPVSRRKCSSSTAGAACAAAMCARSAAAASAEIAPAATAPSMSLSLYMAILPQVADRGRLSAVYYLFNTLMSWVFGRLADERVPRSVTATYGTQ